MEEQLALEEIEEYARWLGMDVEEDKDLFWIAEQGLKEPLPDGWKGCVTDDGELYYFNFNTGDSQWRHPNDTKYKALFQEEKQKARKGQALPPVRRRGSTSQEPLAPLRVAPPVLQPLAPLGQTPSPLPSPGVHVSAPDLPDDLSYTLSEDDFDEFDLEENVEESEENEPPPRPAAPTPPIEDEEESETPDDRESQLKAILAGDEWRSTMDKEREDYAKELAENTAKWKEDEEKRAKLELDDLRSRHKRQIEQENAEHDAALTRTKHEHELEISAEKSSLERRLVDMRAAWDAEVAMARADVEKLINETREQAGATRLASVVAEVEQEERDKIDTVMDRMRNDAILEQKQLADEFSHVKKEQRERLSHELNMTKQTHETEIAAMQSSLEAERSLMLETRRCAMRVEIEREVEAEKNALREREAIAIAALRQSAEEVEKRAADAPTTPHPPHPPSSHHENQGSLHSSLRGEEEMILEQERMLRERKAELHRHKCEIEQAREEVKLDHSTLDHSGADYRDKKAVIDDVRSALEHEAAVHNEEARQIRASNKYLKLRRKRVELMQQSCSDTSESPDIETNVARIEAQLSEVLAAIHGGAENVPTDDLRAKYRHTLRPSMADFKVRMHTFKERLLAWEGERETAVKQLARHRAWLKRFKRDVTWMRHGESSSKTVKSSGLTINLNVR